MVKKEEEKNVPAKTTRQKVQTRLENNKWKAKRREGLRLGSETCKGNSDHLYKRKDKNYRRKRTT